MKKRAGMWIFLIALVVIIAGAVYLFSDQIYFGPYDGTTATRSFSATELKKGDQLSVYVDVNFDGYAPFYDLVESVPEGFDLVPLPGLFVERPDLDETGYKAIQFLNFNPSDTTHTYLAYANVCAGTYNFRGIYLAPPETTRDVLGETQVTILPGSVIRDLVPPRLYPGQILQVYIQVYMACENNYSITEILPQGWVISNLYGVGVVKDNLITWECSGSGSCNSIRYDLIVPDVLGIHTFDGFYAFDGGEEQTTGGQTEFEVISPPLPTCEELGGQCSAGSECLYGWMRVPAGDESCGGNWCCKLSTPKPK
jgi:hypothetical protein